MAYQLDFGMLMLTPRQQAIYDNLREAAETGAPCPTNTQLADIIRSGGDMVRSALDELERFGMIERRENSGGRRTVFIPAIGKETRTASQPIQMVESLPHSVQTSDQRHAAGLKGMRFEDMRLKPTGMEPEFWPPRGESFVGREANC